MSNIMHKVKDAVTGHHDKDTAHEGKISNDSQNTYGSSHAATSNAPGQYSSTGTGPGYETGINHGSTGAYGTGASTGTTGLNSGPGYETRASHGPSASGFGDHSTGTTTSAMGSGTGGLSSGPGYNTNSQYTSPTGAGASAYNAGHGHSGHGTSTIHDSRKGPMDVGPGATGSYGAGTNTAGGYGSSNTGSSNINAGPHDSKMANKLDPRVDSDLDNRGKHAGNTGSQFASQPGYASTNPWSGNENYGGATTSSTGPSGYSSNEPMPTAHGGYNATGNSAGQPGFGSTNPMSGSNNYGSTTQGYSSTSGHPGQGNFGTETGGSSYNAQTSKTGKTTGPHNSDLMNKLDPRVDEKASVGTQRNY